MKTHRFLLNLLLAGPFLAWAALLPAQDTFTVGDIQTESGHMNSGFLAVPPGVDEGTTIPVSIIHGAKPGPVLALIAGTHGYEYPGITALQRLRTSIDPTTMSGTVIMVHIANLPSFLGRTIYYSPADGKNLNRVYPGSPDGTVSDRIAGVITREVIDRADYMVDLHAGDGNEALTPYIYMPVTGDSTLDDRSREMALAFGLDHIVIDNVRLPDAENSLYTDHTALTRGKPAITTETGQLGSNNKRWVAMVENGIANLMRHLAMTPGEARVNDNVTWLKDYTVLQSPADGLFEASVGPGDRVTKNALIGSVSDFFGNSIKDIRAPYAGFINYVVGTPPINKGEPVAMISKFADAP
jgi:predicted deacylase